MKNMFQKLAWDSNSSICYAQFNHKVFVRAYVTIHLDSDMSAFCEFQSVVYKVADDLPNFVWVSGYK